MKTTYTHFLLFALFLIFWHPLIGCAMSAVVCNANYTFVNEVTDLGNGTSGGGESYWLFQQANSNPDGHGMVYYHKNHYQGHDNTILEYTGLIDSFQYGSNNHLYRKSGCLSVNESNYNNFIATSKLKSGKIFLGHTRYRSDGPVGAYAPFIYRFVKYIDGIPDTIDFSFTHHGTIDKASMLSVPRFKSWLTDYDVQNLMNDHPTYYSFPDSIINYVDSDYLFLWLMSFIIEKNGDVKLGLAAGLSSLYIYSISGQINILLSDGNGVWAYTNHVDITHKMSYKVISTSNSVISYCIRSYNDIANGFTPIDPHHLYYFPTQGVKETTFNIDTTVPTYFTLHKGYNWISFPVLDSDYGADPNYTLRDINQFALTLQTKNGTTTLPLWYYDHGLSIWTPDATLSSFNGYILQLNNDFPDYQYLTYGQQAPYNTTLQLFENIDNWLPYFIEYSQTPANAFGDYFSNVLAVYAQDWYIYKFKGQWYGYLLPGATGTLDYGKMYKVYVNQNISNFHWSAFSATQEFSKENTTYFKYEEKPDYQAVVIDSISGNPVFDEIGVFTKSNICVGALKFEGYPINLQVYNDDSPDEYDYILYVDSKNSGCSEKKLNHSLLNVKESVIRNGKPQFSLLKFNDGFSNGNDHNQNITLKMDVYPNPTRREIYIDISSSVKRPGRIDVFNIKGQLVFNIEASEIKKGKSTYLWSPISSHNTRIAQGIYFCRLQIGKKTVVKKIVVLD